MSEFSNEFKSLMDSWRNAPPKEFIKFFEAKVLDSKANFGVCPIHIEIPEIYRNVNCLQALVNNLESIKFTEFSLVRKVEDMTAGKYGFSYPFNENVKDSIMVRIGAYQITGKDTQKNIDIASNFKIITIFV